MPEQDDATDLRIHLARCVVQGLRIDLSIAVLLGSGFCN